MQAGTGKIVTWKADKAYGFIRPDGGGKDLFVHLRDFGSLPREPRVGDVCTFQSVADGAGRLRAADPAIRGLQRSPAAAPRTERSRRPRQSRQRRASGARRHLSWPGRSTIVLVYFAALGYLVAERGMSLFVPAVFLAVSLVSWLMYVFDKSAAMNSRWRTSEASLLLAGLLGGWPGALLAQGMARHKSSKGSFQAAFWSTVWVHCAAVAWWGWFREAP